jgi:5,6-dimethylbenzimidazole synthase
MEIMAKDTGRGFSPEDRDAVYRVIEQRRDVRHGFLPEPLDEKLLIRLLHAAHHGPSVGFMQPARFIVIRNPQLREAVYQAFQRANESGSAIYEGERRKLYDGLKLQGLLEAPQHICVVCDHRTERGHGLGRQTMPQTVAYSVACAIQNLWLAARAEGVGVGWVSIFDPADLQRLLDIPEGVEIIAYLCVGYVEGFADRPDLERFGWEGREDLSATLYLDQFDQPYQREPALTPHE